MTKSISEVISEINNTKGHRQHCNSLHQTLSSDGYVRSIVNWTRVTKPERIDALLGHVSELEFLRDTTCKVMQEFADELGCKPDNEVILQAIDDLKSKVALLELHKESSDRIYSGLLNQTDRIAELEKQLDEWERKAISNFEECARMDEQLRAVVVENAALILSEKELNEDLRDVYQEEWVTELTKTPATSAAIAEIWAKAVEDTAELLFNDGDIGAYAHEKMHEYANKLRGGGV